MRKIKLQWMQTCGLVLALLIASCGPCIAQGPSSPAGTLPGPDVIDNSSSSSVSSSSSSALMTCTDNIQQIGNLPVAKTWKEDNEITYNRDALASGSCIGYRISTAELAGSACATATPDSYILVEFWQLNSNSSSSGITSPSSTPDSSAVQAGDVRVLAAKGVQPWVNVGPDGHVKITPPVRDADTGITPVGTFQDDDAVIYGRSVSRIFFPTNAVVVDSGKRLDPKSWYITIANMPAGTALPSHAIRAACITPSGSSSSSISTRIGSSKSAAAAAAAGNDTASVPCPVPTPGGKQCSGRGVCRIDSSVQNIQSMSYCDCQPNFGSWGCQRSLQSLPINSPNSTVVTIGPGQWAFWEVTLPGAKPGGVTSGPVSSVTSDTTGSGTSGDTTFAAAAAGLGPGLLGNEALLLTAVRVDVDKGFGGNPLIFLKPFMTEDHNEPCLDALNNDLAQYSDLRSFQLQLNKQYIYTRLPLQNIRGNSNSISITYSMPRRWYVAVYNSNASRLSEPAKLELQVQYRDLNRQQIVCPFNCSDAGKCVDPITTQVSSWPLRNGMLGPTMPVGGLGSGGRGGGAPDPASVLTAIGPMQDISPVDAGFMCVCDSGFGGLTCEGRVQNVAVGTGEQKLGPETLNPGDWWFYLLTVDPGFNPQTQNLGIEWTVGSPSSPPSNYTNAFMSFDQGPVPRQLISDRRLVVPVRKGMTPYSKLIPEGNPPLPLKVPGNQLLPGGSYVVSIYNSDYVIRGPFQFTLGFFVTSDQQSFLHPYMSILLGVTAAVILCLAMTLCKRLVMRYGIVPWRWRQRRRQLAAAAAAGVNAPGGNSLALVLMAQQQQQQQSNRGVPPEIYQSFPCRPYAAKDYQQRQQHMAQQQQQQDVTTVSDQAAVTVQPVVPPGAGTADSATDQAVQQANTTAGTAFRSMLTGLSGLLVHHSAAAAASPLQQQQQVMQSASVLPATTGSTVPSTAAAATAAADTVSLHKESKSGTPAATAAAAEPEVHTQVHSAKDDELPSCTVCLCEYVADEMVRQLPCGHEFHQGCIDQWMANHGTCPICRAPLWHGAFGPEDEDSENNSDDDDSNNPAAIYVHHDMPAAGFRGRSSSGSSSGDPAGTAAAAAAAAGDGAVVSAPAAAAAAATAAAGGVGGNLWFGVNNQQPQRLRWQQRHRRRRQQQPAAAAPRPADAVPTAAADNRRRADQQQQQQQGDQTGPAGDDAV